MTAGGKRSLMQSTIKRKNAFPLLVFFFIFLLFRTRMKRIYFQVNNFASFFSFNFILNLRILSCQLFFSLFKFDRNSRLSKIHSKIFFLEKLIEQNQLNCSIRTSKEILLININKQKICLIALENRNRLFTDIFSIENGSKRSFF